MLSPSSLCTRASKVNDVSEPSAPTTTTTAAAPSIPCFPHKTTLNPQAPVIILNKTFRKMMMATEGRRGVHPGSARQGGEWLSVDRRAELCVHAHLLARDTPCRAPTKRERAHTPAFSQPACTLAVVPAVGPSEQRPRDTVPRMTWGTHAQMQVGTALQQVCR